MIAIMLYRLLKRWFIRYPQC